MGIQNAISSAIKRIDIYYERGLLFNSTNINTWLGIPKDAI